ncbi:MAG: hypothetical protein KDD64_14520, partial [Bdellovibrionales bacterium]|nr:hypothetical protein [Bdellovibrionales bacterium]
MKKIFVFLLGILLLSGVDAVWAQGVESPLRERAIRSSQSNPSFGPAARSTTLNSSGQGEEEEEISVARQTSENTTVTKFDHLSAYFGIAWDQTYKRANANITASPLVVYEVTKALTEPAIAAGISRASEFSSLQTIAAYQDESAYRQSLENHPEAALALDSYHTCVIRNRTGSDGLPRPWPVIVGLCSGGRNIDVFPSTDSLEAVELANTLNRMHVGDGVNAPPPIAVQYENLGNCFDTWPPTEHTPTNPTNLNCFRRRVWDHIFYRMRTPEEMLAVPSVENRPSDPWTWKRLALEMRDRYGEVYFLERAANAALHPYEAEFELSVGARFSEVQTKEPCAISVGIPNTSGVDTDWVLKGHEVTVFEELNDTYGSLYYLMYRMC